MVNSLNSTYIIGAPRLQFAVLSNPTKLPPRMVIDQLVGCLVRDSHKISTNNQSLLRNSRTSIGPSPLMFDYLLTVGRAITLRISTDSHSSDTNQTIIAEIYLDRGEINSRMATGKLPKAFLADLERFRFALFNNATEKITERKKFLLEEEKGIGNRTIVKFDTTEITEEIDPCTLTAIKEGYIPEPLRAKPADKHYSIVIFDEDDNLLVPDTGPVSCVCI